MTYHPAIVVDTSLLVAYYDADSDKYEFGSSSSISPKRLTSSTAVNCVSGGAEVLICD